MATSTPAHSMRPANDMSQEQASTALPRAPQARDGLDAWLDFLEALHPVTIELGLERVRAVYQRMQLDFTGQQLVIIGGTNGKGSSVAMLSGILRAAGHS